MQIKGFRRIKELNKDFDLLVQDIKSSPPEPGVEKILIPGEPEILNKKENYKKGIPLLPTVLEKLRQIGLELNLSLPH
jgi:LDH2 family malate/lactate/ureidoglycolate dehydrogenase